MMSRSATRPGCAAYCPAFAFPGPWAGTDAIPMSACDVLHTFAVTPVDDRAPTIARTALVTSGGLIM